MLVRVLFTLSAVFIIAKCNSHQKPKPSSTPAPTTTTESTTTPHWTTEITPPTYPTIYPRCCGQNEFYIPPRIAPPCDVHCIDIAKECRKDYKNPDPQGCYCLPGYCRNKSGNCISFYEAFVKCH